MHFNQEYDLIVSLGGNCMVANNMRYRDMRPFSLPFDWVFMDDEKPLIYLIEGFRDRFRNLLLKENLVKVSGNESHKIIYKDLYTGYHFPNHFKEEILTDQEYLKVYDKLNMRIDRMLNAIDKSKSILFILAKDLAFKEENILTLYKTLVEIYPNKNIYFRIMQFSAEKNEEILLNNNILICKYSREQNLYDFTKTNYEWAFLDEIKISNLFKTKKLSLFKKLFIMFCPIKEFRRELRNKFIK